VDITAERLLVPPAPRPGDAAIRQRHPIDAATWVWHPDAAPGARSAVRFAVAFSTAGEPVELEISADQRFILSCDGVEIGRGPDRSEPGGWSCHRYRIALPAGAHRLDAVAWWLPDGERPGAQASVKPAFAVVGLGAHREALSTGIAAWTAQTLAWNVHPRPAQLGYHVIGCGFALDGAAADGPAVPVAIVQKTWDDLFGTVATPWRCAPSPLPEQARSLVAGGRIRLVQHDHDLVMGAESGPGPYGGIAEGRPVTVPAGTTVQILWDFADYVCGYPRLVLAGGAGSTVEIGWAESLYDEAPHAHAAKGDRAACAGKHWLGFADLVLHPGGERAYDVPWWRSGRWLRLAITTGAESLTIRDARPLRTGHPFTRRWAFSTDRDLAGVLDLCERGLRNCVHETFVDCPYYEQMQYVGDTRVQALAWLAATGDARPVRRALELFDRSRWVNGFIAERVPTTWLQMSATYSLVQPALLRDYALWADDAETVRALLPGTRSAIEHALGCVEDDLPHHLPGWLFCDWVKRPDWARGVPGSTAWKSGDGVVDPPLSSVVALHLPVALDALARVEDLHGDPLAATRWRAWSRRILDRILAVYGAHARGIIGDDAAGTRWSEHAQALALDCTSLPAQRRSALLDALEHPAEDLARASVYFSHHVHEALLRGGRVEAVLGRLAFWEDLARQGFLTTLEAPEPSRSDCHGWGAHPLYHCLSGLAGIRPAAAGFAAVRITPRFGPLHRIRAELPHPRGAVTVDLERDGDRLRGRIDSPVPGTLLWGGGEQRLSAGATVL
jgi:alpha-L-rhamnosidase